MAKSTCLLALFVAFVVYTEAIRIDPPRPSPSKGRYFPHVKRSDPRCNGRGNGLYADPNDCTKYLKCVDGDSQERKCPEDFKFDSARGCVPPDDNPDCGKPLPSGPSDEDEKCPDSYGMFPVKSDCHKYMVCTEGKPKTMTCPEHQVYRDANGACVDGDECPPQQSEETVCKEANQLYPVTENCRQYIKCVNFQPIRKECPSGKAFNPGKKTCTKEWLDKCKNNTIQHVGQDE